MKEGNMKPLPDKAIITCALTGVFANRKHCPAIPYTPVEIAEEARRAYEAGASIVHIHAREDDGTPTWRLDIFRQIMEEVRSRCPVILHFATNGEGVPLEDRRARIQELKPEMAALNMGTFNYVIYSERKNKIYRNILFQNPLDDLQILLEDMKKGGVKPECECFDTGHIGNVRLLIDMGVMPQPVHFGFIMGVYGGIQASPQNLLHQVSQIPEGSTWEVIGISLGQWHMLATALAAGGNIRVGLEDNFYTEEGNMVSSNAELVEKAVRMTRDVGREPATVEEARQILGLKSFEEAKNHSRSGAEA